MEQITQKITLALIRMQLLRHCFQIPPYFYAFHSHRFKINSVEPLYSGHFWTEFSGRCKEVAVTGRFLNKTTLSAMPITQGTTATGRRTFLHRASRQGTIHLVTKNIRIAYLRYRAIPCCYCVTHSAKL